MSSIPASPWGQVTLRWRPHFLPRPDTSAAVPAPAESGGWQEEAAGWGSRRRQKKEAAEGGSSADPTHTSIICHLSSSVTQGGFAAILSLSLPEGTVTCKGHHLGGGSDAIFPASLHTLVLGGCHLGKGISTILGVSLSLGELWDLGILYLGIIYCYFLLLQFHLLANYYLFAYIYSYLFLSIGGKELVKTKRENSLLKRCPLNCFKQDREKWFFARRP